MFISRHPSLLIELWGQARGGRSLPASFLGEEAGHPGARSRCGPGPDRKAAHGWGKWKFDKEGRRKTPCKKTSRKYVYMRLVAWVRNRNIYGVSSPQPGGFHGWNKALGPCWEKILWIWDLSTVSEHLTNSCLTCSWLYLPEDGLWVGWGRGCYQEGSSSHLRRENWLVK